MIGAACYELKALFRDRRSTWIVLCLAVIVLIAFAGSVVEISRAEAIKQSVATQERERWLGQGAKDPHSAAHYSVYVFKPAPVLAVLDIGTTAFVGQSVWLEAHHQNDMLYRPQQDSSLLQRMGSVSPASLILVFGPLVIFMLAYTTVARDRDLGALRLALGAARHPLRIVAAKAGAVWSASVGLLVVPVTLLAGVLLLVGGADVASFLRLALWLGVMAAYLAVATAFGTALALQSAHPRLALIGLFAIWISVVLVLPRLVSSAIDAARPLPSSQAVRQEILDQAPAYWSVEEGNRQKAALLKLHGVTRLEDIANPRMAELDMVEKHSHQVFDRVLGKFYAQVFGQDALFSWAGFLSPAIAVQALSASVAGTDFSHHHHFIRAAELHRRDLVNRMNADGMAHRAHGDERHLNDRRLWSQIAPFSYREPSLTDAGWVVTPSIVALLLWLLAGMLLLGHVARRLKP